jgi:hypothetical protein
MAYLVLRARGELAQVEIREALATPAGPRSRTLASFRGALTPEILEAAAARASRPFRRDRLLARARALGVPVTLRREDRSARELLAALRRGDPIDPVLVRLLKEALEGVPDHAAPPPLAEVSEWVGASDAERGQALRDLLRLSGRIRASRSLPRERKRAPFPRFRSRRRRARPR